MLSCLCVPVFIPFSADRQIDDPRIIRVDRRRNNAIEFLFIISP
jgi:hypothetical protein